MLLSRTPPPRRSTRSIRRRRFREMCLVVPSSRNWVQLVFERNQVLCATGCFTSSVKRPVHRGCFSLLDKQAVAHHGTQRQRSASYTADASHCLTSKQWHTPTSTRHLVPRRSLGMRNRRDSMPEQEFLRIEQGPVHVLP